MITFGTNPGMGIPITARVPDPSKVSDPIERESLAKALPYMDLQPNESLIGRIGECGVYRKLHEFTHVGPAGGGVGAERPQGQPEGARHGGSGIDGNQARKRKPRASTESSANPAPNGAKRAARCASR